MLAATLVAGALEGSMVVNAAEIETVAEVESDFEFDASTATITKYLGKGSVVEIPESLDGVTVKAIGEVAFSSNEDITEVTIPEGVESIGAEAFLNCPNLEFVDIPDSVTTIEELTFFMCENLEEVSLGDGITTIEENAFYGCSSLENISLPEGLEEVGPHAFMECQGLEEIAIPDGVTTIGTEAFRNCVTLEEITIPSSVQEFGEALFEGTNEMTIVCDKDSPAYSYAQANGFTSEVQEVTKPTNTPTKAPTKAPTNTPTKEPTKAPTQAPVVQPSAYKVEYVLKGGKFTKTAVSKYDGSVSIRLTEPVRKGYEFDGWYTDSAYKEKVTILKRGSTGDKKFYAKWVKIKKPSRPSIASLKNSGKKKMTLKLKKKVSGADGYEMVYATNLRMTKNKKTVRFTGKTKTVKNLKKGKKYYVKVRAYKIDSAGKRVYGSYTILPKTVKISK